MLPALDAKSPTRRRGRPHEVESGRHRGVYLPDKLWDRLTHEAKRRQVSRNHVMRELLARGLGES